MAQRLESPEDVVRVPKIIAFAMIFGAITFMAIGWFVGEQMNQDGKQDQIVSIALAAISLPKLLLFFFLPKFISEERIQSQSGYQPNNVTPEMKPYHTKLRHIIAQYAVLEGACAMNVVAYIIERNWWSLAIAGVFVLFMLSNFPSETRFKHFAETQQTFS